MKRFRLILLLLLLLLFVCSGALAQTAEDMTARCKLTVDSKAFTIERMYDRDWETYWQPKASSAQLTIEAPEKCYGLYICWTDLPSDWILETKVNGNWVIVHEYKASPVVHQYYPLDGLDTLRLTPTKKKKNFGIEELYVLGKGDVPPEVQRWNTEVTKCDLMVLFAHPDDEVLFLSGVIPHYAGDKKLNTMAGVLTYSTRTRRSELLNSLWYCGLRNYPIFLGFHDKHSLKLETSYGIYNKNKVNTRFTEVLRQYKPDVLVTHDLQGEYGHGAHRMVADACLNAVGYAADGKAYPDSLKKHGAWQVKKLYLHLYPENQMEMDWDLPLASYQGMTAFEVAQKAYQDFYPSQHRYKQFSVQARDAEYSSYKYGLAYTTVGEDIKKDDFFEHLDFSAP